MGRLARTYLPVKTGHSSGSGSLPGLLGVTPSLEEQKECVDEEFDVAEEVDTLLDGLMSSLSDSVS